MLSCNPIITERVSCGDEILYPSCSLCPKNVENPGNWCKGNCYIDSDTGYCKEKGIKFHNQNKHIIVQKCCQILILLNVTNIYLSDEFNQISKSFCSLANTYGVYDQLATAKLACLSDDSCIGIYDQSGNATGKMRLCQKGFIISDEYFSTIYQKKEYSGKNYRFTCNCL